MAQLFTILLLVLVLSGRTMADHASPFFETGIAGAIMTASGSTLPKSKFVFVPRVQFIDNDELSDETLETAGALDEEVHSVASLLRASANLAYGISNDLTVGLSLPYVKRSNIREAHHDMGMGEVEVAGDSKGLGDMAVFSQYRFYHNESNDIAAIVGLKTPTGDTDVRENDGALFELELQPGSGSWDPFIGIALNRNWDRFGFSSNVLYRFVTEGKQDTNLGDIFNYNVAGVYRVFSPAMGHEHHSHTPDSGIVDYIDLILELNGDYRQHVKISGVADANTGGNTIYIAPGIRVGLGHSWSVFASGGIPIVKDLNGIQSEPEYRVVTGISKAF